MLMLFVPFIVRNAAGVVVPMPRNPEMVVVASVDVPEMVRAPEPKSAPVTDMPPANVDVP